MRGFIWSFPSCFLFFLCSFLQSLKSRGFVKETYNWRHYYWYLNNDGTLRSDCNLYLFKQVFVILQTHCWCRWYDGCFSWDRDYVVIWNWAALFVKYPWHSFYWNPVCLWKTIYLIVICTILSGTECWYGKVLVLQFITVGARGSKTTVDCHKTLPN